MEVDITDSTITILLEVDGNVCAVKMEKDKYEAVSFLVRKSIHELIKTNVTQDELNKLLLPSFFEE